MREEAYDLSVYAGDPSCTMQTYRCIQADRQTHPHTQTQAQGTDTQDTDTACRRSDRCVYVYLCAYARMW